MTCERAIAANTQRHLRQQMMNASREGTSGSHPAQLNAAVGECRVPLTPLIASAESSVKGDLVPGNRRLSKGQPQYVRSPAPPWYPGTCRLSANNP